MQTGYSVRSSVGFGIYSFTWWGNCDPEKEGYKKLLGNFYFKKNADSEAIKELESNVNNTTGESEMNGSTEGACGMEFEEPRMNPKEELANSILSAVTKFERETGVYLRRLTINHVNMGILGEPTKTLVASSIEMEMKA